MDIITAIKWKYRDSKKNELLYKIASCKNYESATPEVKFDNEFVELIRKLAKNICLDSPYLARSIDKYMDENEIKMALEFYVDKYQKELKDPETGSIKVLALADFYRKTIYKKQEQATLKRLEQDREKRIKGHKYFQGLDASSKDDKKGLSVGEPAPV